MANNRDQEPHQMTKVKLALLFFTLFSSNLFAQDENTSLANFQPELNEAFSNLLESADPLKGEQIFMRKCSSCHDDKKQGGHGKGPHLWNTFSRKAGSSPGFEYSDAMQQSGHIWTFASLNYYLTRTDRAVPGRSMNFRGMRKDEDRAALIKYLWTLNDSPPPLP